MRPLATARRAVPVVGIVLLCSLWIWSGCSEITEPNDATEPSLSPPLFPVPSEPMNSAAADYEALLMGPYPTGVWEPVFFVTPEGTGWDVDLKVWFWDFIDNTDIPALPLEHVRLYLGKTLPDGTFVNHLCGSDFVEANSQYVLPGGSAPGYQFPIEPYAMRGAVGKLDYFLEIFYRDQWIQIHPHEDQYFPTAHIGWRNVDMNGDGVINLSDAGFVVEDWQGDDDWWKSDFNLDGAVNNTDLGIFGERRLSGESCQ